MAIGRRKDYFCTVVSEDVVITLKRKSSSVFETKGEFFVQCNQEECQYVDINQHPCPLTLDLFADVIENLEEKRGER